MAGASEVRFEDVMVHFTTDELGMLEKWQRDLYFEVLMENYESLIAIGNPVTSTDVIAWFKQGERQNCTESQESRAGDPSATAGRLGQISSERYTEMLEPSRMGDGRFEEEMAQRGKNPEYSCVPFMQQGSPLSDECIPHLEKATGGPASPTHSPDTAIAPKPYECQGCGDRFRLKGLLRIHQMVSLRKPSLPCPECGTCVPSCWHLKRHQRIHRCACAGGGGADCLGACQGSRVEERLHFCAYCGETFRWYLVFLQHQKSHEEAKVWPCMQCDVTFMYQSDLVIHEESHFSEALCVRSPCGENCVCRHSFLCHFAPQFGKSVKNSRINSQEDEKLHWEVKGNPEKPYSCHRCGEKFRLEGNLEVHYRYCHKEQLQKYRYSITAPGHQKDIDKQVRDRSVPKACRKSSRPPLPASSARWSCSHCRKSFPTRYILGKHLQRHKVEEHQKATELDKSVRPARDFGGRPLVGIMKKLHKCQECGKRFVFKQHLVMHMKVHAEERTFRGESLGGKGRFGEHLRIHSGERPPSGGHQEDCSVPPVAAEPRRQGEKELRPCAECGKILKKSYFPDHRAWHTGVRYRCLLCGHVSNFKSGAHRHLQQHRKTRDFSCPKCGVSSQSKSCVCLIERISLGQKLLPPVYNGEGLSQPPASYKGGIPSGTMPGK